MKRSCVGWGLLFAFAVFAGCGGERTMVGRDGSQTTVSEEDGDFEITFSDKDGRQTKLSSSEKGLTLPEEWPEDVATPPDAKIITSATTDEGQMLALMSTQPVNELFGFFQQEFEQAGWEINVKNQMVNTTILSAKKDSRTVTAVIATQDGNTNVNLIVSEKD